MQTPSDNRDLTPSVPPTSFSTPKAGNQALAPGEQLGEQSGEQPTIQMDDPLRIEEERLKAYARLLDSAIRLPGGFRIGLDGIVGLIPGIGDVLGAGLSGYFIYAASRLDIPRRVVARMIINTMLETIIGMVPVVGDVFDFIFKANDRNAQLLHTALEAREHTPHTENPRESGG